MKPFLFSPFFVLAITFLFTNVHAQPKTEIMTLGMIMDTPQTDINEAYNKLTTFLEDLNYTKWTFCIWDNAFNYWLYNSTRLNTLKEYGEVIPRLAYIQQLNPNERITYCDEVFETWLDLVGYYPSGIHDYTYPDSFLANYVRTKYGCVYYQGTTQDAYQIDYVSNIGSWQLPYYPDIRNIQKPKPIGTSIVMLPHNIWDWYVSYTVNYGFNTHPINILNTTTLQNDLTKAKNYFFDLIENNMEAIEPYGYSTVQFEWCWSVARHTEQITKEWLTELLTKPYSFMSYKEFASWFMHFPDNPVYKINFVSPYNGECVEWFWSTDYRIARHNGKVVSYLKYKEQANDKYLTQTQYINWGNPQDPNGIIQLSLNLTINALGGGIISNPIRTASYNYPSNLPLDKFYQYYKTPENTVSTYLIASLVLICLSGLFAYIRSKNLKLIIKNVRG